MDHKQRGVVLDFLCNSSYTNTARAFSRECTVRNANIDADGDEIMSGNGDGLANGEDADLILSEGTLQQIELRKGEYCTLGTQGFRSDYLPVDPRRQKSAKRFFLGEWMRR